MSRLPDIVWIVADHQVHATAPPGVHPLQAHLARIGTRFSRARTVLPICTPARASMLTGLYPHAHGLTENDGRFGGRAALMPDEPLVHGPLVDAGYRAAWFGKWHVSNEHAPRRFGFEGVSAAGYGYPYALAGYCDWLAESGIDSPVARVIVPGESGLAPGTRLSLLDETSWFDDESGALVLEGDVRAHEAFFLADAARRWFESANGSPRFLRLDPWGPHPPYLVGAPFADSLAAEATRLPSSFDNALHHRPDHHRGYRDEWQGKLGDDPALWQRMLRAALEQAVLVETALLGFVAGLDPDNTLVVFTTDHGDAVGTSGGVANKGALLTEATLRVPLLMAGAGVPAGRTCNALVANMDIMATVLETAGLATPPGLHARSLHGVLRGQARSGFMAQHYGLHERIEQRAWFEGDHKLVVQPDGFVECYDLAADPHELTNLALDGARHREYVKRLARGLAAEMAALGDDGDLAGVVRSVAEGV